MCTHSCAVSSSLVVVEAVVASAQLGEARTPMGAALVWLVVVWLLLEVARTAEELRVGGLAGGAKGALQCCNCCPLSEVAQIWAVVLGGLAPAASEAMAPVATA